MVTDISMWKERTVHVNELLPWQPTSSLHSVGPWVCVVGGGMGDGVRREMKRWKRERVGEGVEGRTKEGGRGRRGESREGGEW